LHASLGDIPPAEFETLSSSSTVHLPPSLDVRGNQLIRSPRNPARLTQPALPRRPGARSLLPT
jgi:hypothetical protein